MRWAERPAGSLAAWLVGGLLLAGVLAVLGALALARARTPPVVPVPGAATSSTAPAAVPDRVIADPRVTESSGLAVSRLHEGVLWTHNDSGDGAHLYAVGPDGSTLATLTLAGLEPRDWEAMAPGVDAGGAPVLWVGDIGDNNGARENGILVHRVPEPAMLADAEVQPVSYRLRYPGPPVDAESLLVDPRDGRLVVVTKSPAGGTAYAAPLALDPVRANLLEPLGDTPGLLTDGAFLPDGRMALRGYAAMWVGAPDGGWGAPVALPAAEQGESLAVSPDGGALYVGTEGGDSPVWRLPAPVRVDTTGIPVRPATGSR